MHIMPKCDNCHKEHNRKRLCSNKCKDRWHNRNNPERQRYFTQNGVVEESEIADSAGADYAAGWDEDGWVSTD